MDSGLYFPGTSDLRKERKKYQQKVKSRGAFWQFKFNGKKVKSKALEARPAALPWTSPAASSF